MKKIALLMAVVSLVTAGAVLMGQARTPASQPSRVATLRLADVLSQYQKLESLRTRVVADQELYKVELKRRSDITEALKKQLDELQRGSADYKRLDEQLWKEAYEARAYMEVMQGKLERARLEGLAESYQDVINEVRIFCQENGIDMVQITGDVPLDAARNLQELEQIINGRRVIYNNPAIDITDIVLKRLNDKAAATAAPR